MEGEKFFIQAGSDTTRENSFKLKEVRLGLHIRKKFSKGSKERPENLCVLCTKNSSSPVWIEP